MGVGGTVQLTTDVKGDVWPIKVDIAELETALINLTINARDAMPDGGTIKVSAENVRLDDEANKGTRGHSHFGYRLRHPSRHCAESVRPVLYDKPVGKGTALGFPRCTPFPIRPAVWRAICSETG